MHVPLSVPGVSCPNTANVLNFSTQVNSKIQQCYFSSCNLTFEKRTQQHVANSKFQIWSWRNELNKDWNLPQLKRYGLPHTYWR